MRCEDEVISLKRWHTRWDKGRSSGGRLRRMPSRISNGKDVNLMVEREQA
jgi:hypothetical protein